MKRCVPIPAGILSVTNIYVSGNVAIQGQPIAGFDWIILDFSRFVPGRHQMARI